MWWILSITTENFTFRIFVSFYNEIYKQIDRNPLKITVNEAIWVCCPINLHCRWISASLLELFGVLLLQNETQNEFLW